MPKFACVDTAHPEQPVIGWYDTDRHKYPTLPEQDRLIEASAEIWAARCIKSAWFLRDGALVPGEPLMIHPQGPDASPAIA